MAEDTVTRFALGISLLLLAVILRLMVDRLRLPWRWFRRELPKLTVTIQPSTPARPMTLPARKGFQGWNVRLFVGTFGLTKAEHDLLQATEQRLRTAERGPEGTAA